MTIFDQYLALSPFRQKTGVYDRQTDRRSGILPRHSPRYAYASRGKNSKKIKNVILCSSTYWLDGDVIFLLF